MFFQGSVKLKDVLVDFSWEQWECLNTDQKNLYKMVTLDSYEHMMSLGKNKFSQLIKLPILRLFLAILLISIELLKC